MIFTRVLAVAIAAVAVSATPAATSTSKRDLTNPLSAILTPISQLLSAPAAPVKRLTNADRIARGLSPNKPNFARRHGAKARRSAAPCVPVTGVIGVQIQQGDGTVRSTFLGSPNSFGEFQPTDDQTSAVTLSVCTSDPASTIDIQTAFGGFPNFPFLAFVTGFANTSPDFASGSYNYAYLAASSQTPAGSSAVTQPNSFSAAAGVPEGVETNIWHLDTASGALTPSWVNTDGSSATITLLYVPSSNAFAITGDAGAFGSNFGTGNPATFSFIAI